MNKFLTSRSNRFVPIGLAFVAALLLVPAAANATPYVIKLVQQATSVVATGSGAFDLTGLTSVGPGTGGSGGYLKSSQGYVATGSGASVDDYSGFTGPTSFGSGLYETTPTGNGDLVGIASNATFIGVAVVFTPSGYVSGAALSSSATWDNASFASLGVTPGTYVWTWGSAADQSFTLIIGGTMTAVPEPAALGMFGFGMLLIGALVGLRRRVA